VLQSLGEDGVASEKYEPIGVERQLNPFTFYGMEISSEEFKEGTLKRIDNSKVTYYYRVIEIKDKEADVELQIDGKTYRT
jgi:hypothetical protein